MGVANSWIMRIKRKDNKELTREQYLEILNFDFYEEDKPDTLIDLRNNYPEYQVCFYTDRWSAEDDIVSALLRFTEENPIISVQVDNCCTEYGEGDYTRTNYSNGECETMQGFVEYEEPDNVFY